MRRSSSDESGAASSVVTFLVAGVLFVSVVSAVLVSSHKALDNSAASGVPAAELNYQARNLAEVLLGSPGYSSAGGDWAVDGSLGPMDAANGLRRLGLQESGATGQVSFEKFQNLRLAPFAAHATDGYVNYPEARTSLGLDSSGLNFHLRAYPTLQTVRELMESGDRDPNLKVTYIGDIAMTQSGGQPAPADPAAGLTVGAPTCSVSPITTSPNPQDYRLAATVTNGGTVATQFNALFSYKLGPAPQQSQNSNSFVVPAGATATLFVDVPAYDGATCSVGSTISVEVHDPVTTSVAGATTLATATSGAVAASRDIWLDTDTPYFVNPTGATSGCQDPVELHYGGDLAKNTPMSLRLYNELGTLVSIPSGASSFQVPASQSQRDIQLGCLVAGTYTARLFYNTNSAAATATQTIEQILVTLADLPAYTPPGAPAPVGASTFTPTTAATTEVDFLHTLVDNFCPYYFDSTTATPLTGIAWNTRCQFKGAQTQPGDVFPDSKRVMNEELHDRLLDANGDPRYDIVDILVAGSGIDQTAMTSQAAKGAVADWVMGGGTLIVFGSDAQNVNWLEPIFHAAIRSSSGGLGVPDPGHPVLHVADELDYPHYDNDNRVWNFNGQTAQQADQLFTNVVVQGGDPVTTISNGGAMGSGTVILTTWQPYDAFDGARDPGMTRLEGLKLTNNLLMQGYRDLFLDYGPTLPANTDVVPAVRTVQIQHPDFVEPIQVSIDVFVFK